MAIADDFFGAPYVDVDEWRDEPVRHRYVHGGFEDTDTRFSFSFPPEEQYRDRFISWIEGGQGGNEHTAEMGTLAVMNPAFAVEVGAILAESNQGHVGADLSGSRGDSTIISYRASAESARYVKRLAEEMYGREPRYGYVTGGSGGGVRSINCFERGGLWHGAVPFVMPHPGQGVFFSLLANVIRLMTPAERSALAERTGLGGSGDPFDALDTEQREALAALYRAGFPRGAEFVLANPFEAILVWSWHSSELMEVDPGYWEDFWNKAGYAGADRRGSFDRDLLDEKSTVARVVTGGELFSSATPEQVAAGGAAGVVGPRIAAFAPDTPLAVIVEGLDDAALQKATGAKIHVRSGAGAGRTLVCLGAVGDALVCSASGEDGNLLFDGVLPGDEVQVTTRDFVAYCFYHRTQVDMDVDQFGEHYPEWNQFLVDGRPMYPQREPFSFNVTQITDRYLYEWTGKMIICQNLHDIGTWPVGAVNYRERLRALRGDEADRDFRLWWFDHAAHLPGSMFPSFGRPAATTRLIDYSGCVQQAMKDLIAWVEDNVEPPVTTGYEHSSDGAVMLADTGVGRGGIQPVPTLTVAGSTSAAAISGETTRFVLAVEVPPGAGALVAVEWDLTGDGVWSPEPDIDGTAQSLLLTREHTYSQPGRYWPTARVFAHRDGAIDDPMRRIPNLAQVRLDVN